MLGPSPTVQSAPQSLTPLCIELLVSHSALLLWSLLLYQAAIMAKSNTAGSTKKCQ